MDSDLLRQLAEMQGLLEQQPGALVQHLFEQDVAHAHRHDPALAAVMPLCAIPRSFTPAVIGVLRDAPADDPENARLFAALSHYSYVQPFEDGSYTYHDTVRELLLEQWRTPAQHATYTAMCQRLAQSYREQAQQHFREAMQVQYDLSWEDAQPHLNAALALLNAALDLHDDLVLYRWRGIAYADLGLYDEALPDLERVLAVDPDDGAVLAERGWAFYKQQRYAEAIADLTRALALPYDLSLIHISEPTRH